MTHSFEVQELLLTEQEAPMPSKLPNVLLGTIALFASHLATAACDTSPGLASKFSSGWGVDHHNTRLQPDTSINRANVSSLKLKWVYGLANSKPRSWPLVTEDTIFFGDTGKGVVALDRETGCERWVHRSMGEIGSAILHARIGNEEALVYGDRTGGIIALRAADGSLIWQQEVADEPVPFYSGTPVVTSTQVFVPLSSLEIGLSANPFYGCCETSGGMAALDLETGKQQWYLPTINETAQVTHRHWLLVDNKGPSGAPVWGSATYDAERDLLYYGTGQNYSHPATLTSDAIFAVRGASGEIAWVQQFTAQDAYNISCDISRGHPNCPQPMGPDLDFGAPPMLVTTADGTELLIAGQKSGDIYAISPDTGETIWHQKIGRGGALGGIHWGLAANEKLGLVYIPVSDILTHPKQDAPAPGLYALDVATGEIRWSAARSARCEQRECSGGLSAAIFATPELVVAGSLDGFLEIYDAASGEVLWSHDSWTDYKAVNGIPTSGGAFDAHGPLVADNLLVVSSGYGSFGAKGGNALLVFEIPAEDK